MRILIADANDIRRTHARENLGQLGHIVHETTSAGAAQALGELNMLDLTLVDPLLPGVSARWARDLRLANPDMLLASLGAGGADLNPDLEVEADLDAAALLDLLSSAGAMLRKANKDCLMDEAGLLQRFAGDSELLASVLDMYLDDAPERLQQVRAALDRDDPDEAAKAAHSLKGISGSVGCMAMADAALGLEKAGRSKDTQAMRELLVNAEPLLDASLEQVRLLLARL